ncbi:ribonuclease P protein component [Candidatus Woesebacteria bacterium]|nr:ribonuclease P protein component [Candidatus Woesebacteria bacterium]
MLQTHHRLTRKSDFQKVLKNGNLVQGIFFGMAYLESSLSSGPKIGTIVSNKISKSAVARNRIKRLLRETVRGYIPSLEKEALLVFLAKKTSLEANAKDVANDVSTLLRKSGLIITT